MRVFSEKVKVYESRHALNDIVFRRESGEAINAAKDEIIAYLTDGSSLGYIRKTLTDAEGLYNYFERLKGTERYDELWQKHKGNVQEALNKISTIKELCPDNYLEFLSVTDIKDWGRLIDNISNVKKNIAEFKRMGEDLFKSDLTKAAIIGSLPSSVFIIAMAVLYPEEFKNKLEETFTYFRMKNKEYYQYVDDYIDQIKNKIQNIGIDMLN